MRDFTSEREKLVLHLEKSGYLHSERVRNAILNVPREIFVPPERQSRAYEDMPLPTYNGQTISAPHMNAMMCELLDFRPEDKVLEVGTGSGYHAALIGYIVSQSKSPGHVYTIERDNDLVNFAKNNIKKAKLDDFITVLFGDGTLGYPNESPYTKILVTAAGPQVPEPLITQLAEGGKLCIPVGSQRWSQNLMLITKLKGKIHEKSVSSVMFVPLIGEFGFSPQNDD